LSIKEIVLKFQLQVLEYIHGKDYAHCDVKGANLLIGNTPSTKDRVYLVDFGLASRCTSDAVYTEDARKSNNGTIEYLSRDAHRGGNRNSRRRLLVSKTIYCV